MRKVLVLVVLILLVSTTLALAGWQVSRLVSSDNKTPASGSLKSAKTGKAGSPKAGATSSPGDAEAGGAGSPGEAIVPVPGEYDNPDQRYVTETQRHQNFFQGLAEGQVSRLDVTATDFQPAGNANTSYVYFVLATTSGARSDGMFVMRYEGGLWRIAAVRISGSLAGGTDNKAPDSFEADLARELREQQDFLTKVAEGRLAYMAIDSVDRVGATETILKGKVGSKGGNIFPAEMSLRNDYNIWHLTNIVAL